MSVCCHTGHQTKCDATPILKASRDEPRDGCATAQQTVAAMCGGVGPDREHDRRAARDGDGDDLSGDGEVVGEGKKYENGLDAKQFSKVPLGGDPMPQRHGIGRP